MSGSDSGLTSEQAETITASARKLDGWSAAQELRGDGMWNVRLSQPYGPRIALILGPGGYEDFLHGYDGHGADCKCPACDQWWADKNGEQDRRFFFGEGRSV